MQSAPQDDSPPEKSMAHTRAVRLATLVLPLLFQLGTSGGCEASKQAEKGVKETPKKAYRGLKRGGKKVYHGAQGGAKKTQKVVETLRAAPKTVSNARRCDNVYTYLKKCFPERAKKYSKSRIVAKCTLALGTRGKRAHKAIRCVHDSKGRCTAMKLCVLSVFLE